MWFNNALIYQCQLDNTDPLTDFLAENALKPCPPHARFIYGWLPVLQHGMVLMGVPYSEPALTQTTTGGTPYGVTHVAGLEHAPLSADEISLAKHMGERLARFALRA